MCGTQRYEGGRFQRCRGLILAILLPVLVLGAPAGTDEAKSGTRFVVIGHLYPIMKDAGLMEKMYARINAARPDYVFILGDSHLDKEGVAGAFEEKLDATVYFSPGNHELASDAARGTYMRDVGYLEKVVEADDCRFVLMNSSESAANLREYLSAELPGLSRDKVTILLTHHRIWDDTLMSEGPYQHDKSYMFSELFDLLDGRVQYVFAGNSKRQYFRDLHKSYTWGRQNVNNIYWCDVVGAVQCISVGMGDGKPKAGFLIADVVGKRLLLTGDFMLAQGTDPVSADLLQPDKPRTPPRAPRAQSAAPAGGGRSAALRAVVESMERDMRRSRIAWGVLGVLGGAAVAGAGGWLLSRRASRKKGESE